jgi:hypothetical protein
VPVRQLLKHLGVGASLRLAAFDALQTQPVKQNFAELLGRIDIERHTRQLN